MTRNVAVLLVVFGAVVLACLVPICLYVSCSNAEVRLRNQIAAQQKANAASFDACWKIIAQTAQVAEQYRDSFQAIYPALMEGRYGDARGGALMSWVTESNPQFDTSLYARLTSAIEAQRVGFKRDQQMLLDLKREHDNARTTFPGSWFVGGRPAINVTVVTSGRTTAAFAAGVEDDVNVFDKGK